MENCRLCKCNEPEKDSIYCDHCGERLEKWKAFDDWDLSAVYSAIRNEFNVVSQYFSQGEVPSSIPYLLEELDEIERVEEEKRQERMKGFITIGDEDDLPF